MRVRNREGYADPVASQAIGNVVKEERAAIKAAAACPFVYLCVPQSTDNNRVRAFARFAVCRKCIPLAPDLLAGKKAEMPLRLALMGRCDEVWVMDGGRRDEIRCAGKLQKKIRFFKEGRDA